ncbi:MAG TPA: tyrosine-type recombinase/integrase [Gammaproteobacteria bacterium]|nr:tyrosine-type recombinase/integrase [Gammaproteobacteria bacterium]
MFTDKLLRSLKPRATPYRLYDKGADRGFHVQVSPGGQVTFRLEYWQAGKVRFQRIGSFPAVGLTQARERVRAMRARLDQGLPPTAAPVAHGTVQALVDGYLDHMTQRGKKTVERTRKMLERDAIPHLGATTRAAAVTPGDVADAVRELVERGKETSAKNLRATLHAAFGWGVKSDNDPWSKASGPRFGLTANPVASVPNRPGGTRRRTRVLDWEEIAELWQTHNLSLPYRLIVRIMLLTGGPRTGELCVAPWDEFDLEAGVWTIPKERTKNGRTHLVPLVASAVAELRMLRELFPASPYLLPAHFSARTTRPISNEALTKAVSTAGYTWTPHDLRRTCKTRMGEAGVSKFDRDRIQNHVIGDVSGAHYDYFDYLPEKKAGLEKWERMLMERVMVKFSPAEQGERR